jgi:hypothetical protein
VEQAVTQSSIHYEIDGSLRFNEDDSAYLSRTPASASNLRTWTWSGWVKRGNLGGSVLRLFNVNDSGSPFKQTSLRFDSDQLRFFNDANSTADVKSSAVYRDASAWYHIILAVDTIQGTPANRIKLYVNGEQITALATSTYPNQNTDMYINAARAHQIGTSATSTQFFDGYLAEVNFIDGQALDPSSFGETKSGVWVPKEYAGTYGTNGFYLDFADSADIGNDVSGQGNDWTPNNFTASDVVLDSPTDNFCTLNPLDSNPDMTSSLADGNLVLNSNTTSGGNGTVNGTIVVTSGKWYFEATLSNYAGASTLRAGFNDYLAGTGANAGLTGAFVTVSTNATYMFAIDIDNNLAWTGTDGVWDAGDPSEGTGGTSITIDYPVVPFVRDTSGTIGNGGKWSVDFGQLGFTYTPPTDYLALRTANLPEPAISPADDESPSDYFNTVTYTGDSAARTITGVGFQPDFLWTKCRSTTESHRLHDVVRGGNGTVLYELNSNETSAEGTDTLVTGLTSDGFTIASGSNTPNVSGRTYVAWNWKAGGTGVSNTAGSITSTVSANQDAGFSIVSYTGNATISTVGHGLGVAPSLIIIKRRNASTNWPTWHVSISSGTGDFLELNLTGGTVVDLTFFTATAPTETVFSLGTGSGQTNASSASHIAYCFAEIEGYSKFGSYTGNNNADGPFVYTGFRPKFWMSKRTDSTSSWLIVDGERNTYNVVDDYLVPNTSAAENSATFVDFLSNGVKFRGTTHNDSGATFIYMAFAENPFKYANAR